jgi:putative ABC transport system permease protein
VNASERIYRLLLRAYPRDFRDEYGQEMSLLFRARAGEGRLRLWFQVLGDLLLHAPREHWSMTRHDLRYAFRSWRRTPAIPAVALTALTIGMGANIAIFGVVHAVLLGSLPVPDPDRLVLLRETNSMSGLENLAVSLPNYLSWKEQARSVDLAAFSGQSLTWTNDQYAERLEALAPTASFAAVLGAPLHSGRWFTEDEQRLGQHRVAVLSHKLWRTRFGADPNILTRHLMLNGGSYSIVGVASVGSSVSLEPDLWVPQVIDQTTARRGSRYLTVLGRLKPGVTPDQAQAEMTSIAASLEREFPDTNKDSRISVVGYADSLVPAEIRTALIALLAATNIVLLIACANVANVLLSNAIARRREIAVRTALGAGAARITRQLLTESVVLSVTGAALGLVLAWATIDFARRFLVDLVPRIESGGLNIPVLAFAIGLALLTGVGFGLVPLWQVGRTRDLGLLHATAWGDRTAARNRISAMLVVGQVALTTLLLVGAGLLIQSLVKLQRVPVGINVESVRTAKVSLTRAKLPNGAAISEFLSQVTSDLEGVPGVKAAGVSSAIPLSPGAQTIMQAAADAGPFVTCEWRLVDSGYFRALGITLLRGRLFEAVDRPGSPRVFVISQQTARALYGDDNPVGRRLRLENGNTGEVVGVVADVRMRQLGTPPERVVYFPPSQFGFFPLFNIVVQVDGRSEVPAAIIRDRLKIHDPNLAAFEIQNMRHWVDRSASLMQIRTQLVSMLGGIALLLGLIGIYGVVSYLVAQRTREFGIRVALGAQPWALPLVVVAQGLRYTVPGVALGLFAAALVANRIQTLLFDIDARDPVTFAAIGATGALVAAIASFVPARRAAAVDPLMVLRAE